MGNLFDVREVLEFAVYIEQNGHEFYTETLKKFSDPKFVELFRYLAEEEIKHEQLFKKMADASGIFEPEETYEGEYKEYMQEFCKSHCLADRQTLKSKVANIHTFDDAIEMALSFEKDSVIFFSELKSVTGFDREGSVEKVINEELTHIRKLLLYKRKLRNP
ncbi:MAG: ferritin family protein [Dissulfurispiraceae bacterium]